MNLKLGDIDTARQTIWLTEKYDHHDEQPITKELLEELLKLAASRGCKDPSDKVFRLLPTGRTKYCRDIDGDAFDTLFARICEELAWAKKLGFTAHWIRHTILTWVEREHGEAVAAKYARHNTNGVTKRYVEADLAEVAKALETLTGRKHPLAE